MAGLTRRMMRSLTISSLAISLCAVPVPSAPAMAAKPKAAKFIDNCLSHRKPFEKIKNYQGIKIGKGALTGALIGLATGLLVNALKGDEYYVDRRGQTRKRSESVLPYVIAGGVLGGIGGYVDSRAKTAANREELQALIATDFSKDVETWSPLADHLVDLGNCRRNQLLLIKQQNADGLLNGTEAAKRITTVEKWVKADDKLISAVAKKQTDSLQRYASAVALADGGNPDTLGTEAQILARAEAEAPLQNAVLIETFVSAPGEEVAASEPAAPPPAVHFVTAKSGARLRSAPAATAEVIDVLPFASSINAAASSEPDWLETNWRGKPGFVHRDLLSTEAPTAGGARASRAAAGPVPPAARKPPPPGAAKMLKVRRTAATSRGPSDQFNRAIADRKLVATARSANSAATSNLARTIREGLRT